MEQAFGILVQRWGIFWKPLLFHIDSAMHVLSAAIRLYNFAIDCEDAPLLGELMTNVEVERSNIAFRAWWKAATALGSKEENVQGIRRDLQTQNLRMQLTIGVKEREITRPATD